MSSSSSVLSGIQKIYCLLERRDRRVWLWMIALALLVASLEIITATLVMVFAQVLNDPAFGLQYLSKFGVSVASPRRMIVYISIMLGVVFCIKNTVALIESFFQNISIQRMSCELQNNLLNHFAKMDYKFYLTKNSSEWHAILYNDVDMIFASGMAQFSLLISESCIFICLISLMVYLNPSLAGVIFGVGAVLYYLIKKRLLPLFYQWGIQLQAVSQQLHQHLYQFFHAFKEITILQKQDFFVKCYSKNAQNKSRLIAVKTATSVVPRLIMETLFVLIFVVSVSYLCVDNESPKEIMGLLGGYLYLGFRLMPGLNRMIGQLSLFKTAIPSINRVFEEDQQKLTNIDYIVSTPAFKFENKISLNQVGFTYSNNCNTLHDISLDIKKGECIGIVGETGSGKSTLVDIILGLLRPSEGQILIDDQYPVHSIQWHALVAYVPQVIYLTDDTIEANIAFGDYQEQVNDEKLQQAIDDAQLRALIERLPDGLKTTVGERGIRLSGGERQRIAIARALYRNAQVFIFDEATSALDNDTEAKLMDVLQTLQKNRTFIIVAHRLTTLQGCDRIVVLNAGKIEKIVSYAGLTVTDEW